MSRASLAALLPRPSPAGDAIERDHGPRAIGAAMAVDEDVPLFHVVHDLEERTDRLVRNRARPREEVAVLDRDGNVLRSPAPSTMRFSSVRIGIGFHAQVDDAS